MKMKSKLEKFSKNQLTKKEQKTVTGGDQGVRMYINNTCDGEYWFERIH